MTAVLVYGAYGHTARFVVADLRERGLTAVLSGRDAQKLHTLAAEHPGTKVRPASLNSPAELDRALAGVAAVVNCAGPFGDTPPPLLDAALRAGVHYLDVAGEALVALRTFAEYQRPLDTLIVPAVGFFGALGDLLATAAFGDWPAADDVTIAVALDSWVPTKGSILAGELRAGRRVVFNDGQLRVLPGDAPPPTGTWTYPPPFGAQAVSGEFPTADVVTIARHLPTKAIRAYLYSPPDTVAAEAAGPAPADGSGRSAQKFAVEVVVRRGADERRASAIGRDIYAFSAPLAGEATSRILNGRAKATGLVTVGEAFEAESFLRALPLERLDLGKSG
jgi:hypothetical protein